MKRVCAKMKTVKVKVKNTPEKGRRLNKKFVGFFLGAIILILLSGFSGILLGNNASAKKHLGKDLNKFERIRYWEGGTRTTWENNNANASLGDSEVEYWQPIPQQYALGFVNVGETMERVCFRLSSGKQLRTYKGNCNPGTNKKDQRVFIDWYDGASYMGELFDMRQYVWKLGGGHIIMHTGSKVRGPEATVGEVGMEFRFYPKGTLKALDEFVYNKEPNERVCDEATETCDRCVTDKKTKVKTCYYDEYAYRDAEGKIIYTGSYQKDNGQFMTAAQYEQFLVTKENEVRLPELPQGTFKWVARFKDLDTDDVPDENDPSGYRTVSGEGYIPISGVDLVYFEHNWRGYSRHSKGKTGNTKKMIDTVYCPDSTEDVACYWAWFGDNPALSFDAPEKSIWVAMTSNSTTPSSLIYSGLGRGSDISSASYTIVYYLNDDIDSIDDDIAGIIAENADNYLRTNGKPIEEDEFVEDNNLDPERILKMFKIYEYSDYDPYTINRLISDKINQELELWWYNCDNFEEGVDCKIPYNKEHTPSREEVNGVVYTDGYDFIDSYRIYYGSIDATMSNNFPNTCYSNNTSIVEVAE